MKSLLLICLGVFAFTVPRANAATITYTYDAQHRLVQASYSASQKEFPQKYNKAFALAAKSHYEAGDYQRTVAMADRLPDKYAVQLKVSDRISKKDLVQETPFEILP